MKIQVVSDVHVEFHKDLGVSWIKSLDPTDVDVLVVAGDLGTHECLEHVLMALRAIYPHVVYVVGNHEYYHSSPKEVHKTMRKIVAKWPNIHWLHHSAVVIDGVKFAGTPLWFRDDPMNAIYARNLSDFEVIKDFNPWVYDENFQGIKFLSELDTADVVITHHLPHPACVKAYYKNSPINRFFLCDVTDIIQSLQPQYWIHGHTHSTVDIRVGKTNIIANPMGYPNAINPKFGEKLLLDVNIILDAAPKNLRSERSPGDDTAGGQDNP